MEVSPLLPPPFLFYHVVNKICSSTLSNTPAEVFSLSAFFVKLISSNVCLSAFLVKNDYWRVPRCGVLDHSVSSSGFLACVSHLAHPPLTTSFFLRSLEGLIDCTYEKCSGATAGETRGWWRK